MRDRWDSLNQLLECNSPDDLQFRADQLVQRLGFANWVYTSSNSSSRDPYLFDQYPADWMTHYSNMRYFGIDPVVAHCRQRTTPCLWSTTTPTLHGEMRTPYFREAADFGLRAGIGVPIHGPGGHWGMVSVAQENEIQSRDVLRNLPELHLLATFMHEAGQRLFARTAQEPVHLTAREIDALRWAAEGKTSWEIGQLIGITERTVIFHLNNAAKKLGVLGRRQAVAKAISMQLIAM
jgi:DNA-binding CsgD family transcriptional regulator